MADVRTNSMSNAPQAFTRRRSVPVTVGDVVIGGDAPIVVFLTAKNEKENIQEAMEAGANEFIMKPFDAEIIQSKFMLVGLL